MAGPTKDELARELTKRLQELEITVESFRVSTELHFRQHEGQLADRVKIEDQLQARNTELANKVAASDAKTAVIEEKCRHLERLSDRTWQVWLALIIAFLGLIVAYLKK